MGDYFSSQTEYTSLEHEEDQSFESEITGFLSPYSHWSWKLLATSWLPESIHIYVTALKLHGIGFGPVSVGRSSPSFDTKEIFGSFSSGCRFKSGSPNF
jgi:hypothetical protein